MNTNTNTDNKVWTDLVQWVTGSSSGRGGGGGSGTGTVAGANANANANAGEGEGEGIGGYVHPSIELKGGGGGEEYTQSSHYRGLFARSTIEKGELLIRIPSYLIISGSDISNTESVNENVKCDGGRAAPASPWLKCVGEFIRTKNLSKNKNDKNKISNNKDKDDSSFNKGNNNNSSYYDPYFNSLPKNNEYETLFNWSTYNTPDTKFAPPIGISTELKYLKGTTLGTLAENDRTNQTTYKQYRNSVENYLLRQKMIGFDIKEIMKKGNSVMDYVEMERCRYASFLEASMCISTRGFHLLPNQNKNTTTTTTTNNKPSTSSSSSPSDYNGPFLLPVIDLLNHNPEKACTSLQRGTSTYDSQSYFTMVAERTIEKGEELFHSYGNDLTSAQLLQTFGFVPESYSRRAIANDFVNEGTSIVVPAATSTSSAITMSAASNSDKSSSSSSLLTPVSFKKNDHFIAASRKIKSSSSTSTSYPQKLQEKILRSLLMAKAAGNYVNGNDDEYDDDEEDDEEDLYWDVHDIPDRLMNKLIPNNDFFLPSSSSVSGSGSSILLTDDIITLVLVQFLPEDAYTAIYPSYGQPGYAEATLLDRSILVDDYYLGMLVCHTLLIAIHMKSKEYESNENVEGGGDDDALGEYTSNVGCSVRTMCQQEKNKIETLLLVLQHQAQQQHQSQQRELYGRTIRLEEMSHLYKLYKEVTTLIDRVCLNHNNHNDDDDDNDNDNMNNNDNDLHSSRLSSSSQPPNKKSKSE